MRAILILAAMLSTGAIPAVEPEVLRARAALALAFAAPKPTYAESYRKAVSERKPLVVFVGQPVKQLAGCVCVAVEAFPDSKGPAVVLGLPSSMGLRRVDLPGEPTSDAIRAAVGLAHPGAVLLPTGRCDGTITCGKP